MRLLRTSTSLLAALLAALTVASTLASPPAALADGFVRRDSTRLVDGAGTPIKLHSVNVGGHLLWEGWIVGGGFNGETHLLTNLGRLVGTERRDRFLADFRAGYLTLGDLRAIKAAGFNSIRLPFNHTLLEDDAAPYVYKPEGWAVLDRILADAREAGVLVVLDMHATPGSQNRGFTSDYTSGDDLWGDVKYEYRTIALWRAIAARYAQNTTIAGYDLINEPYLAFHNDKVIDLYKRITAAIREVDRNHLIIAEGNMLAHDFRGFTRWDENMAWSFHQYPFDLDLDPQRTLDGYVRAAQAADVPLWNGEFGQSNYEDVAKFVAMYAKAPLAGTAFWTWKKAHRHRIFGYPSASEPGPVLFQATDAWFEVIDWISNPDRAPKPSAARAEQGLQELLAAIRHDRVTPDPRMIAILNGSGS